MWGTEHVRVQNSKEKERVRKKEALAKERDELARQISTNVLGMFGLRAFLVFDGERHHVGFAVANEKPDGLNFDQDVLDDFFSNCCWTPRTSSDARDDHCAAPDATGGATGLLLPSAEKARPEGKAEGDAREDDCVSDNSPKEVCYIMEEFYYSPQPHHKILKDDNAGALLPDGRKELHFVMEDNYLSPEELRLGIFYPELLSPDLISPACPAGEPNMDAYDIPILAGNSNDDHETGANVVDDVNGTNGANGANVASTRSNAGKLNGMKSKKKRTREEEASQSVRPDKVITPRKRRSSRKIGSREPPEEPPWNGLHVGDLEEQTGDSWVDGIKLRGSVDENLGVVVNPGMAKKSFWPTPLYGSSGRRVSKPPPPAHETLTFDLIALGSEDESSDLEDFEECMEQSKKKEEIALAKYALLFKDDQSWKNKFLDGFKLMCDICFSKGKVKKYPTVMSLLAHAKSVRKLRQPEHLGYAQAIRNLLHLDEQGSTPACCSVKGDSSHEIEGVWPPVVVVENAIAGLGIGGRFVGLSIDEVSYMLKGMGGQGKLKLLPVAGSNGFAGQFLVEFPTSYRGWIDAKHMHHQFELHARSYEEWLRLIPKVKGLLCDSIDIQESNGLLTVDEDEETVKQVLYGYLATPHIIKHIDPSKRYVDWEIGNLKEFFDLSDSDCSQAV